MDDDLAVARKGEEGEGYAGIITHLEVPFDLTKKTDRSRDVLVGIVSGLYTSTALLNMVVGNHPNMVDHVGQLNGKLVYYMHKLFTEYRSDEIYRFLESVATRCSLEDVGGYVVIRWMEMLKGTPYEGRKDPVRVIEAKEANGVTGNAFLFLLEKDLKANVLI